MRRWLPVLSLIALLGLSCGKKDTAIEIQFWNFGGTPNYLSWVRARIDTFNATHPGIRVVVTDKSWNMIREILYAGFSAGSGPDLMTVHANYSAEFGAAGYFHPINTFPDFEKVKAWYVPKLIESCSFQGNYYGLPSAGIAFVLVCNKDLFDRAGITPPRTWSEFREAARRLTKDIDGDGRVDQHGLVLLGGDKGGFSYRLAPFFFKSGVRMLSDDMKTITFNSPRAVSALRLFADMYQVDRSITPGFLAYQLSEINDLFSGNRVAMSIEGPWFKDMVNRKSPGKQFYTVPVPVPDDLIDQAEELPTLQDIVMYPISAKSKHLAETWEVLKYLRSPEADMAWIRYDIGGIATTIQALESPEAKAIADLPVYVSELRHAIPWPPHPSIIPIVNNILAPHCQQAIVGEVTPEEALAAAAAEAQQILDGK